MSSVTWQDPPDRKPGPTRQTYTERKREMDANRGKWLLWDAAAKSRSQVSRLRRYGYEATSERNPDGSISIYARRPEVTE